MTATPLPPTPRCDAEVYESGPTAANYGIADPDVVVDYTFAQQLERELIAADTARADLEAENKRLRRIAWLIGSIFVHGNFKAETRNEFELEKLLRENGTFWESLADFDARAALEKQP